MSFLTITNDKKGLKKFLLFANIFPECSVIEIIENVLIIKEIKEKSKSSLIKPIRQPFNLIIVDLLKEIIKNNPDLRFTQILSILELDKDKFYEEPHITLQNIESKIEKYKLCVIS